MALDLRSTLCFVAVAEEQSFTRAAERLRIAQPWLSTRIRKFEEQLGFPLFARNTRRVELTEQGRSFLDAARGVAQAADAAERAVLGLQRHALTRLRIGAPPYSVNNASRYTLLHSFSRQKPGIDIELEVGYSPVLLDRLLSGDLDLAFLTGPATEGFEELALCPMDVEVLFRHDDPLAADDGAIPVEALAGRRMAVFTRALHPWQFDILYAPLERSGVTLVPVYDVDPTVLLQSGIEPPLVMARFRQTHNPNRPAGTASRPLAASPSVPFKLVRRKDRRFPASDQLWQLARAMRRTA